MINAAFIKIWGSTAGAVSWDAQHGLASFEYDPGFIASGIELAPIEMPLNKRVYSFPELRPARNSAYNTFKGLPGLLADALPDNYGNQLIEAWLAQHGRPPNSMNPVEQLCFIGTRAMGALEFEPAQALPSARAYSVEIDSLVKAASAMLSQRNRFETHTLSNPEKAVQDMLRIGTSAGGARPKAIIAYNPTTGQVKSGQAKAPNGFEHWLIKLDGVSDVQVGETHGYGRIEMAYYLMAKACGIDIMESKLLEENSRAHFMTKRFDREGANTRPHIQTLCALRHFDYNDVRSYSYEQLFQTMRMLRLSYAEAEQQFRRMVFNVLARNCDDHTKNFSFRLKQGERWELSPAYDVCYAYRPDSVWVSQHALSINGKRTNITKHDLLALAKNVGVKKPEPIIAAIAQTVARWPEFAEMAHVAASKRDVISVSLRDARLG